MGGWHVRSATSLVLAVFLAFTGPVGALTAGDLVSAGLPAPPYVGPAFVVEFDWAKTGEQVFEYGVTTSSDPVDDPGGGDHNFVVGGCDYPIVPMLITKRADNETDEATGLGTWSDATGLPWAGVHHSVDTGGLLKYTILARSHSLCGGYEDVWDDAGCCVRKMPKSAKVTATVRYYPPGSVTPDSPVVFSADVGLFNLWAMDRAKNGGPAYVRPPYVILGAVTLPAVGSEQTATLPEYYDWRLGTTIAAAPPADHGDAPATSGADDEEVDVGGSAPDGPTRTVADPAERLEKLMIWLGVLLNPFHHDEEMSDRDLALDGIVLFRVLIHLALSTALDRDEDIADLAAAYHALGLLGLLLADDTDSTDATSPSTKSSKPGTTAEAPRPKKDPPPMEGRAKKQQREWVWLPAPAVVYQTYPTVEEQTLKTGTWYQMKDNDDRSRDFYNKQGKWIGTNPVKERDRFEVRKQGERPKE